MPVIAAAMLPALPILPAAAQETGASEDDRIVVTGSRIARRDLSAPSPLTTVDSAALAINNTVNAEEFLNDLPQLVPAFDSSSNNPGDGTATLSLRGLGAERTLILVDGKRMVGNNISQVVDINNIPAALIEQIEIVTGGASAVYGSDAVAGVVNFILKDDFEGLEVNATYRLAGEGDAGVVNLDATFGGNFADGRGNAVFSTSYTNREALFQGERDFSSDTLVDNQDSFGLSGSSNIPGTRFRPGTGSSNFDWTPVLGQDLPDSCNGNTCSGAFVNDAGELEGFRLGTPNDLYNFAPTNYLQLPQERYNISGFATYEIADNVEAYGRGIFSHVLVETQLAPTPAGLTFSVEADNPFLFGSPNTEGAAQLGQLLIACGAACLADTDDDGEDEFTFRTSRRYQELGGRNNTRETNTFLIGGGLRGDFQLGEQTLDWDVYAQHGRSSVTEIQTGNLSISAITDAILEGRANIFDGPNSLQPEIAEEVGKTGAIYSVTETTQVLATLSGETGIKLASERPVAFAAGLEYREESSLQQPDSVLGPDVRGFNQSVFVQGRYDAYEVFGELAVPVISDMPFVQSFDINGAFRYSDYSSVGGVTSFAVGGEWQIDPNVRLRAQFQRAVRAPNLEELFITPFNGFPGASDPCDGGTFGAWDLLSDEGQAAIEAACIANGVPAGEVGEFLNFFAQIESVFSGFGSELEAEEADTLTLGAVFTPEFAPGLSMSVDYYDIEISNAIGFQTTQSILEDCIFFDLQGACNFINRDPTSGEIITVGSSDNPVLFSNQVGLFVRGIDVAINYSFDLPENWGTFNWRFDGTHTLEDSQLGLPGSVLLDCAGFYGGPCGEPTPEWKFTTFGTWQWNALTTTLRYSWISGVDDIFFARYDDVPGGRFVSNIESYGNLDLNVQYAVTESVTILGGIDNIFDADVPILGDCCNEQANTWPATYETLGRQFFFGARLRF